jgi:hypothetical protein
MSSGEALPTRIQEERRVTQLPSGEVLPKRIQEERRATRMPSGEDTAKENPRGEKSDMDAIR